jgi:hypothetical protein
MIAAIADRAMAASGDPAHSKRPEDRSKLARDPPRAALRSRVGLSSYLRVFAGAVSAARYRADRLGDNRSGPGTLCGLTGGKSSLPCGLAVDRLTVVNRWGASRQGMP